MTGTTDERPDNRRSTRFRLTVILCAALPMSFAGWLGWQALAGDGSSSAAAAPAAVPAQVVTPTAPSSRPATLAAAPSPSLPAATPTPTAGPLNGRTVLIDPGHNPGNVDHSAEINSQVDVGNGHKECDTTGTSTDAGYSEADYTLDVSRRVRVILQARGAKVVFTQDGDRPWGPCVDERAKIGNDAHADAAISVHGDGAPASGSGFHVIMPAQVNAGKADTSAIVAPSHRLGVLVRDQFQAATGEPYSNYLGEQGLDTRSDLGGLNLSVVPKVFIECGNMRNPGDAGRMTDPQWRQKAAQGIADGLTAFLTTPAAARSAG
ncbi:N-acetylmuramoyl-L-alanine amidase [Kitasatospora sp. MAP5-34]|uniref:N-acetylmuramoyl-L-alanine amidase n=1 Tax=Kitasatospora sp. MAP5-34 TaxID=3035102 RepID=UPI0024756A84|nr:N-acetylmuramoyl-L-alanine amidase [Kitasatospora sp. MAP5-34]MDH6574968.1 N-acetylmuramoyl-L-alanine amidase [Kitasatospora sp. MAP5-34]